MGCGFPSSYRIVVTAGAGTQDLCVIDRGGGNPGITDMTGFTAVGTDNVAVVFTGGLRSVVTAGAVAGNAAVIHLCGQPRRAGVTGIAIKRCCNVTAVFASGDGAIVTTHAGAQY